MAKVQIIMPVTLDGFLPDKNEKLMVWLNTDRNGFPYWEERATFNMYPHYGMLDLMDAKERRDNNCTFFMKVQDTLKTVVDGTLFQLSVDKLRQAKQLPAGNNPVQTVEVLADRYLLNQSERGSILRHFISSGDCSQYGLINAVTRASQDIEDYGRATELERLGGELLASAASAVPVTIAVSKKEAHPMKNITPLALVR